MGASMNMGGPRAGRRGRRYKPMSEINVTPFVDVMLVLLIVFMISAPLLTAGVPIELPEARAKPLEGDTKPLTVSVDAKGRVFLQSTEIKVDDVVPKLKAVARNGYDERVYVRADKAVDYGAVMKVMGVISAAGFRRIGLVTEPDGRT
jgi:biopolymer transport protein TolR